jgi:hypothetical protein
MRGFLGSNGRVYSDAQRRAIFANVRFSSDVKVPKVNDKIRNRFALPLVPLAAGTGMSLVGSGASAAGTGVGASIGAGTGATVGATAGFLGGLGKSFESGVTSGANEGASNLGKKVVQNIPGVGKMLSPVEEGLEGSAARVKRTIAPGFQAAADVSGVVLGEAVAGIGEPYMHSNPEWLDIPEEDDELRWSHSSGDDGYMDVDAVKKLVKKQYPHADVDTKIKLLEPGKYTQFALKENPGREREAVTSNGFYSPTKDTAYLEKDPNKLNALRATIHELVHDMSDDGVNTDGSQDKYMLNEGYADYVAKRIMTDELKLPEKAVNKTIGYPKEEKQVEHLVALNGRKRVDKAFLVNHSLEGLTDGWRQETPKTCL